MTTGVQRPALAPGRTLGILLGASRWHSNYGPAETFAASAAALRDYFLAADGLGIGKTHFLNLFNSKAEATAQLQRLEIFISDRTREAEAIGQPLTDIVIAGISHGEGTANDPRDLHLATYRTKRGNEEWTGLSIRDLAKLVRMNTPRLRRFVLLDCCFSGAALAHFQSNDAMMSVMAANISRHEPDNQKLKVAAAAADPPARRTQAIPARGTILLCSSHADEPSMAKAKDGLTLFGSCLRRALGAESAPDGAGAKDCNLTSFFALRESICRIIEEEIGPDAPLPQLYAPVQAGADLTTMLLLPLRKSGRRARPGREAATQNIQPARVPAPPVVRSLAADIKAFCSKDPLIGDRAVAALAERGADILTQLLPQTDGSAQHRIRLQKLCAAIGEPAIPILCEVIGEGSWDLKLRAAPCFAAFQDNHEAKSQLYELLKVPDFDSRRLAIEAVGYAAYRAIRWEIVRLAKYDDLHREGLSIDDYSFDKLYSYVVEALVRCFVFTGDDLQLSNLHSFLECCIEQNRHVDHLVHSALRDIRPAAADALLSSWLGHADPQYRDYALRGLERLRLQRAVEPLIKVLLNESEQPILRERAGIALGAISTRRAAQALHAIVADPKAGPGVDWAFSTLYAQPVDWTADVEGRIRAILDHPGEVRQQLLCALAWRGRTAFRGEIEAGLSDADSFVRGTSALALAHLLGQEAVEVLRDNLAEATSPAEKAFTAAALIHAGRSSNAEGLHGDLQRFEYLADLRPIWKREILTAFIVAEGGSRRILLWAEICGEPPDIVVAEYDRKRSYFSPGPPAPGPERR